MALGQFNWVAQWCHQWPRFFLLFYLSRHSSMCSVHCLHEPRWCQSYRSQTQTWHLDKEERVVALKRLFLSVRKTTPLETIPVTQEEEKEYTLLFSSAPLLLWRNWSLILTDLPVCQKVQESWIFLWNTLIFKRPLWSISFYTLPQCLPTAWKWTASVPRCSTGT